MYDQENKSTSDFLRITMYVMSLVAHASERGSAGAQSGEEGDGSRVLRPRARKRAPRYDSGEDEVEWTGTSSAKRARPAAASATSDELEQRISTAIGFTHQFKFAGASPQITNQQQVVIITPWNRLQYEYMFECYCKLVADLPTS